VHTAGGRLFRVEAILASYAFRRHAGADSEGARRSQNEVDALASSNLEVFELNFALLGAHAAGIGASTPEVAAFGKAMATHQREDGGFGSGPASNGFETVLAMRSLEFAGLASLPRTHAAADHAADPAKSDHGI
jgi:hypothetical protein